MSRMKTLPFSEARKDLSKLVDEVDRIQEHVVITKNGKPKAVLMSSDEFEGWQETLEILADPKSMRALRQSLREVKAGKVRPLEDVLRDLGI